MTAYSDRITELRKEYKTAIADGMDLKAEAISQQIDRIQEMFINDPLREVREWL